MTRSPDSILAPLGRMMLAHARSAETTVVATLDGAWQREVDAIVSAYNREIFPQWQATAEQQVSAAVSGSNADALLHLAVPSLGAAELLAGMQSLAAAGAAAVVAEAKRAGLDLPAPPPVAAIGLADWARLQAQMLSNAYAASATREALRLWRPRAVAADVAAGVRAFLSKLTDRGVRDVAGGALTRAQNLGKLTAYAQAPAGWDYDLIADETLDSNTCPPCRKVDGTILPTEEAAMLAYGGAGYLHCEGGQRCRGTVRGVWRREPGPDDVHRGLIAQLADVVPYSAQIIGPAPGRKAS